MSNKNLLRKDPKGRKWQITINNPTEKGFTHEHIKEELDVFPYLYV
jgi:hypothetical protein